MLPITNHRSFHVPHSLATAAAIVALVTAIGWNASGSESTDVERAADSLGRMTSTTVEHVEPAADPAVSAGSGSGDADSGVLSGLLPLVLPNLAEF